MNGGAVGAAHNVSRVGDGDIAHMEIPHTVHNNGEIGCRGSSRSHVDGAGIGDGGDSRAKMMRRNARLIAPTIGCADRLKPHSARIGDGETARPATARLKGFHGTGIAAAALGKEQIARIGDGHGVCRTHIEC